MAVFQQVLFLSLVTAAAYAADVLLVTSGEQNNSVRTQVLLASQFYGLDLSEVSAGSLQERKHLWAGISETDILAVVVSTEALADLDRTAVFRALERKDGSHIPLLILATGLPGESGVLRRWSDGAVQSCTPLPRGSAGWRLAITGRREIAQELAGSSLDLPAAPNCGLVLSNPSSADVIATVLGAGSSVTAFVSSASGGQPVFIAVTDSDISIANGHRPSLQSKFSPMAILLMFLRSVAGERAWHTPGQYANLTIDDPWLTEPYGALSYAALLTEMRRHNFHTTIAFVPWNFDRSDPQVVDVFRNNPDRLSLCIHGNNHNHREFDRYDGQPLDQYSTNLLQALARMERFKRLTGLGYDNIMVFPHGVAPVEAFALLRKYNYAATVNSQNVPLGLKAPDDSLFGLRPWTMAFKNIPSIQRVSAEVPVSAADIAVNAFLGNPQLFYAHHEYFQGDIGAFDHIADAVNTAALRTIWGSLGVVVRHLYLMRRRANGDYDLLAASAVFDFRNPESQRVIVHVQRPVDFNGAIRAVTINGKPVAYREQPGRVSFDIPIEPGDEARVELLYATQLNLASVDTAKRSMTINMIRHLCDFRDLYLSRIAAGRTVQQWYYHHDLDRMEMVIERGAVGLLLGGFALVALGICRTLAKRRRSSAKSRVAVNRPRSAAELHVKGGAGL